MGPSWEHQYPAGTNAYSALQSGQLTASRVLGKSFYPGLNPPAPANPRSSRAQVPPGGPWALPPAAGAPRGRPSSFSPTDGSCACHLEVSLNTIWSYWPRNFQPMYLMDRSSTFRRVWGRFGGSGALLSPSLSPAHRLQRKRLPCSEIIMALPGPVGSTKTSACHALPTIMSKSLRQI